MVVCVGIVSAAVITPAASAQPPGFPDINNFADVTNTFTQHGGRGTVGVKFATPDGLSCGLGMPSSVTSDNQLVQCNGPLPGIDGASNGTCDLGYAQAPPSGPGAVSHSDGNCPSGPPDLPILNPGQKVSYGNIACGVAPGGVTACINTSNGEHGFVLQPSGSWSF